jgi:hypothetical protein
MLNRKNLLILAAVIVVLVAISALQRREPSQPSADTLIAGDIARADLDRLEISHGDSLAVVLASGPEGWYVASAWNVKANEQRLDTLLQSLSNLRGEYRSDEASVVADYGFDEAITLRGLAPGGAEVFAIEVGGKPEGGRGNFVKEPGSSRVYLSGANLLSNLGLWSGPGRPENRHFLDLQAYKADRQDVDRISLMGEETVTLIKEFAVVEPAPDDTLQTEPTTDRSQWEWRLVGEGGRALGNAVKTKADGVLSAAVNVRAQDVVDPDLGLAAYGLEDPARAVVVTLASGEQVTLAFGDTHQPEGDAPAGVYMVVPEQGATVWVVGEFAVNNLLKTSADLLPEE